MEWKYQSDGSTAPGHERFIALHPLCGSRDNRYVISRPAVKGKELVYIALLEAMHACTDGAACFAFWQEVCPGVFVTLALAQEACQHHASCGNWPPFNEQCPELLGTLRDTE